MNTQPATNWIPGFTHEELHSRAKRFVDSVIPQGDDTINAPLFAFALLGMQWADCSDDTRVKIRYALDCEARDFCLCGSCNGQDDDCRDCDEHGHEQFVPPVVETDASEEQVDEWIADELPVAAEE